MFWEDKKAKENFYKVIINSKPFKTIYANNFNSTLTKYFAERMAIATIKYILHPNFDESLREACLQEIGKQCCLMFLKYKGINTNTDVATFLANLNTAFRGHRRYKRMGKVICDEALLSGQCWCPIVHSIGSTVSCSEFYKCGRSARETYFRTLLKKPVEAEWQNTVLLTGSDTCKWLIHI